MASDMIPAHSITILSHSKCQKYPKTKGRILCTEDDANSRELMVFILKREGYDVTATETPLTQWL